MTAAATAGAVERETRRCGCAGSGLAIRRCDEATTLWEELLAARDAMVEGERTVGRRGRGHKGRLDAFAEARAAYHGHVREGVA